MECIETLDIKAFPSVSRQILSSNQVKFPQKTECKILDEKERTLEIALTKFGLRSVIEYLFFFPELVLNLS